MATSADEIVIYLGPSLAVADARRVLDADYRAPVRRGDFNALLKQPRPPKVVGVIDGEFFQSFAISPKEILPAIESGMVVLGSSSMGALRATELHPFGMIGVGRIFEMFHSGELDADDEVAMVFDRESGKAHSVPMVNVRIALEGARVEGILTVAEERALVELMKEVYFPERTYPMLLKLAGEAHTVSAETAARLRDYLKSRAPDGKRDDGLRLLGEAKRIAATLP